MFLKIYQIKQFASLLITGTSNSIKLDMDGDDFLHERKMGEGEAHLN